MGGSSGLIVAFVVALWAAYFVPLVLRRYDEASKNSSLDIDSPERRVVIPRRSTARPAAVVAAETSPSPHVDRTSPAVDIRQPRVTREAARIAARRRRNVLLTLIGVLLVLSGLAVAKVLPVWSPAIGGGLIVAWLVLCRVMVRGERGITGTGRLGHVLMVVPRAVGRGAGSLRRAPRTAAATGTAADEELTVIVSHQVEEYDPDQAHVMEEAPLAADALDEQLQIAVPSASTSTGEPVWDPLPITVPTYVTKPRAGRTVRTIDFDQPGAWTSGHVEGEQTELPIADQGDGDGTGRHAVGH